MSSEATSLASHSGSRWATSVMPVPSLSFVVTAAAAAEGHELVVGAPVLLGQRRRSLRGRPTACGGRRGCGSARGTTASRSPGPRPRGPARSGWIVVSVGKMHDAQAHGGPSRRCGHAAPRRALAPASGPSHAAGTPRTAADRASGAAWAGSRYSSMRVIRPAAQRTIMQAGMANGSPDRVRPRSTCCCRKPSSSALPADDLVGAVEEPAAHPAERAGGSPPPSGRRWSKLCQMRASGW